MGRTLTGELVPKWVCKVPQQFGLSMEHIARAVTSTGTDIKGAFAMAFKFKRCLPHLLYRVTVDVVGITMDKKTSKTPMCSELIDSVKKVVGYFNKSDASKVRHIW